jgi:hypothetical protein
VSCRKESQRPPLALKLIASRGNVSKCRARYAVLGAQQASREESVVRCSRKAIALHGCTCEHELHDAAHMLNRDCLMLWSEHRRAGAARPATSLQRAHSFSSSVLRAHAHSGADGKYIRFSCCMWPVRSGRSSTSHLCTSTSRRQACASLVKPGSCHHSHAPSLDSSIRINCASSAEVRTFLTSRPWGSVR